MAYSFQTFSLAQVLTAAQMNQVEANIRDHEHNVAGVAAIQEGDFAAAAVDQAALKTATAAGSLSLGANAEGSYTLTGGTYAWWTAGAEANNQSGFAWGNDNPAAGLLGVINHDVTVGNENFFVDERYIQASPPYTHGPLFVFLVLDALGNIVNVSVAPDPPWAYHGPTNITPELYIDRKPYRNVTLYEGLTIKEALLQQTLAGDILDGKIEPVTQLHEITLAYKDSDMNVVPHNWSFNKPEYFSGRTVVMLEPGTTLMEKLFEMSKASHAHDVRDLIRDGYLTFDNSPIALPTQPQGVQVIRAGWKKT